MQRLALMFMLAVSSAAGCGDDGRAPDTAVDTSVADGGDSFVTPPTPPTLPNMDCPSGWRTVPVGETSYCDPWPEAGTRGCEIDRAQLPGLGGCERVGTECPADGWPTDLPSSGSVVFVRAGVSGDGSRGSPYATIAEALTGATAGTVIALSTGTYDEIVSLPSGVTLRGACTLATTVGDHSPTLARFGRITTGGTDVRVENLRLRGSLPGLYVLEGGSMIARDVVIDDARLVGVVVQGRLEADGLVVRGTRLSAGDRFGQGINVENLGELVLRHGLIVSNRTIGIFVGGAGATADLEDVAIRATRPLPDDTVGIGMMIGGGAVVTARRLVVEENLFVGISVGALGTRFDGEDVVVRRTSAQVSDGVGGQGILAAEGANVILRRALFAGNQHVALSAFLPDSSLTAEDVIILDTRSRGRDGGGGAGAFTTMGANLTLRRAWIEGNRAAGVGAFGGSSLTLVDLVVRDTRPQLADGVAGGGVIADLDTELVLTRARIEGNRMVGVFAGEGTTATIEDLEVRDTRGQEVDGLFGRGVEAIAGAVLTLERALLSNNRGAGLIAFDSETRITASNLRIVATQPFDCAATGCPGAGYGIATREARIEVDGFILESNALAGAQVSRGGRLVLQSGEIVGHPIGINVQDAPFEEGATLEDVALRDNERNIDAQILPVPEPATPEY